MHYWDLSTNIAKNYNRICNLKNEMHSDHVQLHQELQHDDFFDIFLCVVSKINKLAG